MIESESEIKFKIFLNNGKCKIVVQPTKILLVPSKCEINNGALDFFSFQYCDSNISLFSNAPCKDIALNIFNLLFGISSFSIALRAQTSNNYCCHNS